MANSKFLIEDLSGIDTPFGDEHYTVVENDSTTYKTSFGDIYKDAISNHLSVKVARSTGYGPNVLSLMFKDGSQLTTVTSVQLQDGMLSTAKYSEDSHILSLYFNVTDPSCNPNPVTINLSSLKDQYYAGKGLCLDWDKDKVSGTFSVDFDVVQGKLSVGTGLCIDNDNNLSVDFSTVQPFLSGISGDVVYVHPNGIQKQQIFRDDIYICESEEDFDACLNDNFSFKKVFDSWRCEGAYGNKWYSVDPGGYRKSKRTLTEALNLYASYCEDLSNAIAANSLSMYGDFGKRAYLSASNIASMYAALKSGTPKTPNQYITLQTDEPKSSWDMIYQWDFLSSVDDTAHTSDVSSETFNIVRVTSGGYGYDAWVYNDILSSILQPRNTEDYTMYVSNKEYSQYLLDVEIMSPNADNDLNGIVIAYSFNNGKPVNLFVYRHSSVGDKQHYYEGNTALESWNSQKLWEGGLSTQNPITWGMGLDTVGRNGFIPGFEQTFSAIDYNGTTLSTRNSLANDTRAINWQALPSDSLDSWSALDRSWNSNGGLKTRIRVLRDNTRISAWTSDFVPTSYVPVDLTATPGEGQYGLCADLMLTVDLENFKFMNSGVGHLSTSADVQTAVQPLSSSASFGFINCSQAYTSFKVLNLVLPKTVYTTYTSPWQKYEFKLDGGYDKPISSYEQHNAMTKELGIGRLSKNTATDKTFFIDTDAVIKVVDTYDSEGSTGDYIEKRYRTSDTSYITNQSQAFIPSCKAVHDYVKSASSTIVSYANESFDSSYKVGTLKVNDMQYELSAKNFVELTSVADDLSDIYDSSTLIPDGNAVYDYIQKNTIGPEALKELGIESIGELIAVIRSLLNTADLWLFVAQKGVTYDKLFDSGTGSKLFILQTISNQKDSYNSSNPVTPVWSIDPKSKHSSIEYDAKQYFPVMFKTISDAMQFAQRFKFLENACIRIMVCSDLIAPLEIWYTLKDADALSSIYWSGHYTQTIQHSDNCQIYIQGCNLISTAVSCNVEAGDDAQISTVSDFKIWYSNAMRTIYYDQASYKNRRYLASISQANNKCQFSHLMFDGGHTANAASRLAQSNYMIACKSYCSTSFSQCAFLYNQTSINGTDFTVSYCSFNNNDSIALNASDVGQVNINETNEFIGMLNGALDINAGKVFRNYTQNGWTYLSASSDKQFIFSALHNGSQLFFPLEQGLNDATHSQWFISADTAGNVEFIDFYDLSNWSVVSNYSDLPAYSQNPTRNSGIIAYDATGNRVAISSNIDVDGMKAITNTILTSYSGYTSNGYFKMFYAENNTTSASSRIQTQTSLYDTYCDDRTISASRFRKILNACGHTQMNPIWDYNVLKNNQTTEHFYNNDNAPISTFFKVTTIQDASSSDSSSNVKFADLKIEPSSYSLCAFLKNADLTVNNVTADDWESFMDNATSAYAYKFSRYIL